MWWLPRRTVIYNDVEQPSGSSTSAAASAVSSVRSALAAPQSETTRWRKTFDTYSKETDGSQYAASPLLFPFSAEYNLLTFAVEVS